jgi:hypothetical protein
MIGIGSPAAGRAAGVRAVSSVNAGGPLNPRQGESRISLVRAEQFHVRGAQPLRPIFRERRPVLDHETLCLHGKLSFIL